MKPTNRDLLDELFHNGEIDLIRGPIFDQTPGRGQEGAEGAIHLLAVG